MELFSQVLYIGLGSNLGDRLFSMRAAVDAISHLDTCDELAVASLYQTSPVGKACAGHNDYFNSVIRLRTTLTAREVLSELLSIEVELGRIRARVWESRTIDLDILLYGKSTINEPGLVVPHPRMQERLFVLEPLSELADEVVHPVFGVSIIEILRELREAAAGQAVFKVAGPEWWSVDSDVPV